MPGIFSESRVLLVDDHPVYREGLKKILDSHPQVRVVAEASGISEALEKIQAESIQVLVTDLALVDGTGHELLEQALALKPDLRAVVLSVSRQATDIVRAIKAGALAYLTKSASGEEVLKALDEIMQGRSFLHAEVSNAVVGGIQGTRSLGVAVTPREHMVLDALKAGMTPKEMGAELKMSMSTVRTHLRNIYRKFDVSTRTQLMLKIMAGAD